MEHPETERRSRSPWPIIVIGALALFGAITLVKTVLSLAFSLVGVAVIVGLIVLAVIFFRGPPD